SGVVYGYLFSSRRRHTRFSRDWSSDVCSSDLTRNPGLVREQQKITAKETRATGPQWIFGPCVCVVRDLRWGRSYEAYGEDPGLRSEERRVGKGCSGRWWT